MKYYGSHRCGASLYKADVVITAAHCVEGINAKDLSIRAGTNGVNAETSRKVVSYTIHENYGNLDFDVAVLKLDSALPLTAGKIETIELASNDPKEGEQCFVTGWGALKEGGGSPKQLQGVKVPVVDRTKCNDAYGSGITKRMICAGIDAGGKDSCQGDSGGPLTINGKLAGIVSWGYGCARPGYPGVYANVAELASWIVKHS